MPIQTITNLVFQGGSVKGAAYVGALRALEENGFDLTAIKRVAGTSAGAITALALALGCNTKRADELLLNFDFKAVLDEDNGYISTQSKVLRSVKKQVEGKSVFFSKVPVKGIAPILLYRASSQLGIYEGEHIRLWADSLIQYQVSTLTEGKYSGENLTFEELHQLSLEYPGVFRDLLMIGSNLTTGEKLRFCSENAKTKDVIIADALRISMSIPQVFIPHHIFYKIDGERLKDATGHLWVDGGLYDNYPIDCFDAPKYLDGDELCHSEDGRRLYNPHTLGFRLVSKEQKDFYEGRAAKPKKVVDGLFDYGSALLDVRKDLQEEKYATPENVTRTVYIDNQNVSTLEFNLSEAQRDALVQSGLEATESYMAQHQIGSTLSK